MGITFSKEIKAERAIHQHYKGVIGLDISLDMLSKTLNSIKVLDDGFLLLLN